VYTVHGTILPPLSLPGLWFFTGFLPLVLAHFVIEPYFTRCADALANGLALLVAVVRWTPPVRSFGRTV
jgi:hypothetical protein